MDNIRTAVVGVGYLGKFHAEKYATLPGSKLVAVSDTLEANREAIAEKFNVEAVADYRDLIGKVDAVSIAAPTHLHHEIGLFFLKNGVHVLVEKPIATTITEADELINMAEKNNLLFQVGHLERFNNAFKAVEPNLSDPRFIEASRLAPFKLRGTEVNVILDLMIHDIDLIQSIIPSDIRCISASGAPVLSHSIDIANARIEFENGSVANVTASRVSLKPERKMRIFQHDRYIGMDLDQKIISVQSKGDTEQFPGIPEITSKDSVFDKGDALKDQIAAFIDSLLHQKPPVVSGNDGKRALETALKITSIIEEHNKQYPIKQAAHE